LLLTAIGLVILALGASMAWNFVQALTPESTEIDDYPGAGQGQVQIIVNEGDDGTAIAATLFENGVIASTEAFLLETYANPDAARRIQPGYYVLQKEMKAEYALGALLDTDRKLEVLITIPEGWRETKILERIASVTNYSIEEVEAIAADTESLGLPDEANGLLEGWLFPATYRFNPGVTPGEVLSQMIETTVSTLEGEGVPRDQWLTILTIASIVEREAGLDADRPLISGVIKNRLDRGMRLEMDSTVKYIAPSEGVFTSDEDRNLNNPYNTYLVTGLPPGPIASPGLASIEAAVTPESHSYLFFVTINLDTGETRYATTYTEHLKNVQLLRDWQAAND
jgi:UPF0755 protein